MRSLLAQFKELSKPIKIVNDRSRGKTPYTRIAWSEVASQKSVAVICEDLIQITNAQYRILGELLSWSNHHENVTPIICCAHTLTRQNISGLLGAFCRVYVTVDGGNAKILNRLLTQYDFDKEERRIHVRNFTDCKIPHSAYYLDVPTNKLTRVTLPFVPEFVDRDDEKPKSRKRKRSANMEARANLAAAKAERFLSVLPHSKECLAIFDLLYYKLPKAMIDGNTLEITLQQKGSALPVVVSLVEYIGTITDSKNRVPASSLIHKFHKYTRDVHNVRLPAHFVLNPDFR